MGDRGEAECERADQVTSPDTGAVAGPQGDKRNRE